MTRRPFLRAAAVLLAAFGLIGCQDDRPSPQTWTLLGAWPEGRAGAERFAMQVETLSGGRLRIEVREADPRQAFEALAKGDVQLAYGSNRHWQERVDGAVFFGSLPFGMTSAQRSAWLGQGGQALWEEAYAPHGLKPLALFSGGQQLGGWFNREIAGLEDVQGLSIRQDGLAGEVLERLGARRVQLPAGEVAAALNEGRLDAGAGGSLDEDLAAGLPAVARYGYYPAWQGAEALGELLANRQAYAGLAEDLQAIVAAAARNASQALLDAALYRDALALEALKRQGVELRRFPEPVLDAFALETEKRLGELAAQSELGGRIWASQKAFQAQVAPLQALQQGLYEQSAERR